MLLREYTNDALMDRVIKKLESAGLRPVDQGKGRHAAVFRNRSGEIVKAFEQDECYLYFISLIQRHKDNPHFPMVRKVARFTQPELRGAYVLKLESLTPLTINEFLGNIGMHCFLNVAGKPLPLVLQRLADKPGLIDHQAKRWQQENPQFAAALGLIIDSKRDCDLDLYRGNFMKRGTTWVITDPYIF